MKTAELTGAALDWAVAKCEGLLHDDGTVSDYWQPSELWEQAGAIIEREGINTYQLRNGTWQANLDYGMSDEAIYYAPTPLIAAMRCYVASKLGDTVEVPKELTE